MRRLTPLLLVAMVLLAGCASLTGGPWSTTDTATETPETVTPVPVPAPPDQPTPDAVTAYALERERAVTVNARTDASAVEVETDCEAWFDRWVDGDYYAVAACGASVESVHDGQRSVSGFASTPAVYRVDQRSAQRVPLDDARTLADPYRGDGATDTVDRARGLAVVNFDGRPTSVTVRVVHEQSGETALNETYRVDAVDGRAVRDALLREGRYRVVVSTDDGTTSRSTWRVDADDAPGDYGFAVYVTPGSGVTLGSFE
jgi:hypothetical protein